MLIVICTRELLYVGRAHPGYNQVTLERSDFRTDFRTRQKSKGVSMNDIYGGIPLTLRRCYSLHYGK